MIAIHKKLIPTPSVEFTDIFGQQAGQAGPDSAALQKS
jgi:hypothetical protein